MNRRRLPITLIIIIQLFFAAAAAAQVKTIYILKTNTTQNLLVMRVQKQEWQHIGKGRIVASKARKPSLHIPEKGVPVVGYIRYPHVEVKKFTKGTWADTSPLETAGKTEAFACAADAKGNVHVAYEDKARSRRLSVLKYQKDHWGHIGKRGFSEEPVATYLAMTVGEDGSPLVAYCGARNTAGQSGAPRLEFVAGAMAWSGSSWQQVGKTELFKGAVTVINDIKMNRDGIPFVAIAPMKKGSRSGVMRLAHRAGKGGSISGDWQRVGSKKFWKNRSYPMIEVDGSNNLYIAYRTPSRRLGAVRVREKQFREMPGIDPFNRADVIKSDIAMGPDGTPYLVFTELLKPGVTKMAVIRHRNDSWRPIGEKHFKGYISDISMAVDRDGSPYVALVLTR